MRATDPGGAWHDGVLLALSFGVIFFIGLGDAALVNPDEGRYAEIPREMVASGDYVTPRLDGVLYFEKPPLLYWMVAGMLRLFGPQEIAMRAPAAFFALAGVLVVYGVGRWLYGRVAGLAAALVLGSSLLYFALGRILLIDMVVSVLMCAALFCFLLGVREPAGIRRRWFFYGLYASAALATLAKGLIGFLVPGAVMFSWLLVFNQWRRLRPFYLPTGLLLFLAIAVPWHVLAAQRNPGWAHFYFVREHWERFTTTEHGRTAPWWFFVPVVLLGLFPWTGCLWGALRSALAGGWSKRSQNADAWFLVTWAAFVFLFFSKSQSKLIPYILPVFPPLALLIGRWLGRVWEEGAAAPLRLAARIFGVMAAALGAAIAISLLRPDIIGDRAQLQALRPSGLVAAMALLCGGAVVPWFCAGERLRSMLIAVAASVGSLYLVLADAQENIARPGTKELASYVRNHAQPDDRVFHYYEFFHDFTFYAQQVVGTVAYASELELSIDPAARASGRFISEAEFRAQWSQPRRIWVVARKKDVRALFTDPGFRYHLLGETRGHYLFSNQP